MCVIAQVERMKRIKGDSIFLYKRIRPLLICGMKTMMMVMSKKDELFESPVVVVVIVKHFL